MSNLSNSVLLMGNLGRDPELTQYDNGRKRAQFSLATHDYYRNQNGEMVTKTDWHRCVAWGKNAERLNELLSKGKKVAVRGKISYNSYEDKEGVSRTIAQVEVKEFFLMGDPPKQEK